MEKIKEGEALCRALAACLSGARPEWEGQLRTGVDLGTANIVVAVVDSRGQPVAGELQAAEVVRDGLVVDFVGAREIVSALLKRIEERLGTKLEYGACAVPPGTRSADCRATRYVVEAAGLEVLAVVDEPTAAARVLGIRDGAVVDIGGGTTGISVLQDGEVVYTADEPTGGTHFTLVLAGHFGLPFREAEKLKLDPAQQPKLYPILRPVMEKIASIVERHVADFEVPHIYLVGGASAFLGLKEIIESRTDIPAVVPQHPLLVTPLGIALMCPEGGK
ncbi:MAG: ethanolamine utilization protein EutJ [Moorellaceae bacterium]